MDPDNALEFVDEVIAAECNSLRAEVARLREELREHSRCAPVTWDADVRDQFQQWARNRARAALTGPGEPAECCDRSAMCRVVGSAVRIHGLPAALRRRVRLQRLIGLKLCSPPSPHRGTCR